MCYDYLGTEVLMTMLSHLVAWLGQRLIEAAAEALATWSLAVINTPPPTRFTGATSS